MLLKLGLKFVILGIEIFLGVYSMILTDSLLVRFIFFVVTAVIIAFLITKITDKLLPSDKDQIAPLRERRPLQESQEELEK